MKFFLPLLAALSLTGCAVHKDALLPKIKVVDVPPLEEVRTAEVGDTILDRGKIEIYKAIELKNEVKFGDGVLLKRFTVEPGRLVAKNYDKTYTYYFADHILVYDAMIGTTFQPGGLAIATTNESKAYIFMSNFGRLSPSPKPDFAFTEVEAVSGANFRRELIYNGKSGNTVKFLYRELSGPVVRSPFTQEVQYDLNDSKEIGFKNARIEIIEASNTQLKYRVLKNFPW